MESHPESTLATAARMPVGLTSTVTPFNQTLKMAEYAMSGHIAASLLWFLVGFLYILCALRRFYSGQRKGEKFVSSVEFPLDFLPGLLRNFPFVALLKIVGVSVFLALEIDGVIKRNSSTIETSVRQHETMAMLFLLSGVVDMIALKAERLNILPHGTDYLVFILTFSVQTLQFVFHLEGRTPLSARLHALQGFLAAMCALALLAEVRCRNHVIMPVIRGYWIMAQGTWMMNLMFILYHPGQERTSWNLYSYECVKLASMMFVHHLIADMVLVLVVNLVFARLYAGQRCQYKFLTNVDSCGIDGKQQSLAMEKLTNGYHLCNGSNGTVKDAQKDCDGDSGFEFQRSNLEQQKQFST